MTVQDRCTDTKPHPAHRTQYGPFGVKDCPGVPITPANAPTVPDGPAPASAALDAGPTIRTLLGFQRRAAAALTELAQITAAMADHLATLGPAPASTPPPRPGKFCHVHFSWLCQAGQGRCQAGAEHPAAADPEPTEP